MRVWAKLNKKVQEQDKKNSFSGPRRKERMQKKRREIINKSR
jgi:hypothetical protein